MFAATPDDRDAAVRATWTAVKQRLAVTSAPSAAGELLRYLEGAMVVGVILAASGLVHGVVMKSGGPDVAMTLASYTVHVAAAVALLVGFRRFWEGLAGLWAAAPYLLLAAGSYAWSAAPEETMKNVIGLLASATFVSWVSRRYDCPTILEFLFKTFSVIVILCYLYAVAVPSLGMHSPQHSGAWSGVFIEKNKLGSFCCFTMAACCARFVVRPSSWPTTSALMLAAFGLLLLCTSKTALLAGISVLATFGFVLFIRRGPIVGLVGVVAGVILFGGGLFVALQNMDLLLSALGKSPDLTSRTAIWESVRHLVADRPLGFGYGAFWGDSRQWASVGWVEKWLDFRPGHGHNAWVDARVELGQPGPLALGLIVAVVTIGGLTRPRGDASVYWAAPFIAFIVLTSVTETTINAPKNLEAILLLLTLATVAPLPRGWRPASALFMHDGR